MAPKEPKKAKRIIRFQGFEEMFFDALRYETKDRHLIYCARVIDTQTCFMSSRSRNNQANDEQHMTRLSQRNVLDFTLEFLAKYQDVNFAFL